MAYGFEYEIRRLPEARNDGSGMVNHEIHIWIVPDDVDPDTKLEYQHKTVCCPAQDVIDVVGSPGIAGNYKAMLAANWNTQPVPITGPSNAEMIAWYEANQLCVAAVEAVDALGVNWPYFFPK